MNKANAIATLVIVSTVIQQGLTIPAIGFSAVLSNDTHLGNDDAIKYDNVLTNLGNGYDKWCGHFVVPTKGLYVFSCSVMATNTNTITVGIIKNDKSVLPVSSANSPWETSSRIVVLSMDKGDRVWVRRLAHDRNIQGHYNSFSGYLISTET
uniref:C1q domain-containing protein n=1 Tax=Magallana gigas TaxID=29159 RepID=A0A8W8LPG6_MAGGI